MRNFLMMNPQAMPQNRQRPQGFQQRWNWRQQNPGGTREDYRNWMGGNALMQQPMQQNPMLQPMQQQGIQKPWGPGGYSPPKNARSAPKGGNIGLPVNALRR